MKSDPWRAVARSPWTLLMVLAVLGLGKTWWEQARSTEVVPYSVFEKSLRDGKLAEVLIGDDVVSAKLRAPEGDKTSILAGRVEPALADRLAPYGVTYGRVREGNWLVNAVSWAFPGLLLLGFWMLVMRRLGRSSGLGLLSVGQSKAKVYMEQSTGVRFEDVAGVDEAKAELQEIVDFLKNPKEHGRLGARVPKGVLLMGPTGTGKTLLARAVAGEAGVVFFSISGSEFIEMFVGVGAARVRDLFEQARAHAPAIIFIDELDALGKARGLSIVGSHDEREQTLNQLLVELDGFDPSVGVVLLAATNRPEILDPALLRAGRFDRQVLVDRPDRSGRLAILKVHVRKVKLAPDIDLDQVAAVSVGFAGADLANLVNEAALAATRRQAESVANEDFTQAIERIVAGIEKKHRLLDPEERRLVAFHELGHALIAMVLPGPDKVQKVSIVPRGVAALGYTLQRPSQDRHLLLRSELLDKLTVWLGGRAAEGLVFGQPSTGAADDLARATDLARDMVLRYGMDDGLGPVTYADAPPGYLLGDSGPPVHADRTSPDTSRRIDEAVHALLRAALERASTILRENRAILDRAAAALIERETLDEAELKALTRGLHLPEPLAAAA